MENNQVDLSKIISLIAQNPDLITRIQSLAGMGQEKEDSPEENTLPPPIDEDKGASVELPITASAESPKNRQRLLCAFKPYLSSERAKALDSVLTMIDIFDTIRRK